MRRKGGHHEEHVNHEAWVIPYADLLTLLLAMFLALWATGRADAEKMKALANAFHDVGAPVGKVVDPGISSSSGTQIMSLGGLGVLDGGWTSAITKMVSEARGTQAEQTLEATQNAEAAKDAEAATLSQAATTLQTQVAAAGLDVTLDTKLTDRGLQVVLPIDQVLFTTGSADLVPAGEALLESFAPILRQLDNPIEVVGHTDSQPIAAGGRYSSNLDLSAARASHVGDYLVRQLGFPADQVRASGVGDTQPVASNATAEGRAANRRVELTILFTNSSDAAAAAAAPTTGTTPTTEGTTSDG